jgi:hypothetical protein
MIIKEAPNIPPIRNDVNMQVLAPINDAKIPEIKQAKSSAKQDIIIIWNISPGTYFM